MEAEGMKKEIPSNLLAVARDWVQTDSDRVPRAIRIRAYTHLKELAEAGGQSQNFCPRGELLRWDRQPHKKEMP